MNFLKCVFLDLYPHILFQQDSMGHVHLQLYKHQRYFDVGGQLEKFYKYSGIFLKINEIFKSSVCTGPQLYEI